MAVQIKKLTIAEVTEDTRGTGRDSAGGGLSAVGVHFSNKNRTAQHISPQRLEDFTHP